MMTWEDSHNILLSVKQNEGEVLYYNLREVYVCADVHVWRDSAYNICKFLK